MTQSEQSQAQQWQSQQQQQYPAQMPEIWRLLIVHRTVLSYPDTVTTSYNEVRMQPSDEPGQAVLSARLEIDPFEGVLSYIDYFGTRVSAFDIHRPQEEYEKVLSWSKGPHECPAKEMSIVVTMLLLDTLSTHAPLRKLRIFNPQF